MYVTVSDDLEVPISASEAWRFYRTTQLTKLICERLPNVFQKIDVVQGDGSDGSILEIFLAPGVLGGLGPAPYKEKLTVYDERRAKQVEAVEGGVLDMGFVLYKARFEIIEKPGSKNDCITRAVIEYEMKEHGNHNASLVFTHIGILVAIMQHAAQYVTVEKKGDSSGEELASTY